MMLTTDYDYDLPPEFIAQHPLEPRDASRLLVLDRRSGQVEHARFWDIGRYLAPGDLLVLNETRVIPARLFARKLPGGGKAEILLLHRQEIRKLLSKVSERGWTIVPLSMYLTKGRAKVEIALVRGKRLYDRKDAVAERDADRDLRRELKDRDWD